MVHTAFELSLMAAEIMSGGIQLCNHFSRIRISRVVFEGSWLISESYRSSIILSSKKSLHTTDIKKRRNMMTQTYNDKNTMDNNITHDYVIH